MGKFWAVFKREYLERVRSKWFIIATVFGPIVLAGIYAVPAIMAARTKPTANLSNVIILDATGRGLGPRVSDALAGGVQGTPSQAQIRTIALPELAAAESAATAEVRQKGGPLGYLVLDDTSTRGASARYAGRNASTLRDVSRIERAVRDAGMAQRLEAEGLDPMRITGLTGIRLSFATERITDKGRGGSGMASAMFAYGIAILLYMMIALFGQNVLRSVMEEKTTRVAEVIVSSAPTDTLLAGKVLGVGAVGLTQQIAWVVMSVVLFKAKRPILAQFGAADIPIPLPPISIEAALLLLVFFLTGFIFFAACFAAVGAMVSNQEDAQQAAMPVAFMLIASIVLMGPVLLAPMSTMARVTSILPFTAPIIMPLRMTVTQVPWWEIAASIASISIGCVIVTWLAARIYRVGLLMYGKRPSMRELVHWVRYAG